MKYPTTFSEWQIWAQAISARSTALQDSIHDQGWKLAASVGIPRCGCSLHNASIDDDLKGWCAGNPKRLKVAKRANHILNDWTVSQLASRITQRAFEKCLHVR